MGSGGESGEDGLLAGSGGGRGKDGLLAGSGGGRGEDGGLVGPGAGRGEDGERETMEVRGTRFTLRECGCFIKETPGWLVLSAGRGCVFEEEES